MGRGCDRSITPQLAEQAFAPHRQGNCEISLRVNISVLLQNFPLEHRARLNKITFKQ